MVVRQLLGASSAKAVHIVTPRHGVIYGIWRLWHRDWRLGRLVVWVRIGVLCARIVPALLAAFEGMRRDYVL